MITNRNVVTVKDRYLSYAQPDAADAEETKEERFLVKGIAFPEAPPPEPVNNNDKSRIHYDYNATGWIAVLKQLREFLPSASALNTIRVYRLDPMAVNYSEFFRAAAELGFYVIVPLTSTYNQTGGVLNRLQKAPYCYSKELYDYGTRALYEYLQYPNVLAGVIGNEVMNSMESWYAAPCVKAYARDLKMYMQDLNLRISDDNNRHLRDRFKHRTDKTSGTLLPIPLMYACQHSGIGAAINSVDTVRLSLDYLTCSPGEEIGDNNNKDGYYSIDILGVNIESWCATGNTFHSNVDGTVGTYYQLWQGLHVHLPNTPPLVFSELGCSHAEFNRDSPLLRTSEGTRDWKQLAVVLQQMHDTWSGFSAYTYSGNPLFDMMQPGHPWNGHDVLQPSQDFINFQQQVLSLAKNSTTTTGTESDNNNNNSLVIPTNLHPLPLQNGGIMDDYYQHLEGMEQEHIAPTCIQVEDVLSQTCNLQLYDLSHMPSYFDPHTSTADSFTKAPQQQSTRIRHADSIAPTTTTTSTTTTIADDEEWELRPRYHDFMWNVMAPILIVVTGAKLITFRRWVRRTSAYRSLD